MFEVDLVEGIVLSESPRSSGPLKRNLVSRSQNVTRIEVKHSLYTFIEGSENYDTDR